jgi:hypothetical protein
VRGSALMTRETRCRRWRLLAAASPSGSRTSATTSKSGSTPLARASSARACSLPDPGTREENGAKLPPASANTSAAPSATSPEAASTNRGTASGSRATRHVAPTAGWRGATVTGSSTTGCIRSGHPPWRTVVPAADIPSAVSGRYGTPLGNPQPYIWANRTDHTNRRLWTQSIPSARGYCRRATRGTLHTRRGWLQRRHARAASSA